MIRNKSRLFIGEVKVIYGRENEANGAAVNNSSTELF
jgi:hypothetical protein